MPSSRRFVPTGPAVVRLALVYALALSFAAAVPLLAAPAAATAKPLATAATNWDGVSVDLMSVERKGSVLTVKWAVRNEGSDTVEVGFAYSGKQATTYAVDEENGTKYFVLTDKEGKSVASEHEFVATEQYGVDDYVKAGQTQRYWMKLPAPPPEVETLTLLFSNTEPFEEVAIVDR